MYDKTECCICLILWFAMDSVFNRIHIHNITDVSKREQEANTMKRITQNREWESKTETEGDTESLQILPFEKEAHSMQWHKSEDFRCGQAEWVIPFQIILVQAFYQKY